MSRARLALVFSLAALAACDARAQELPLQISDPTPRAVLVSFERSTDPAAVGQVFGPAWPAAWSVSAGVGRVELSAETHGLARADGEGLGFEPVPGSFSPLAIEIDLATLEATSEPTGGALESGPLAFSFGTGVLDTTATAGFIGPNLGALLCSSQQEVDDLCPIIPLFCGATCTLVSGSPYDPATGLVNLVGPETQQGCDGAVCQGPFTVFATTGDLRVVEAAAPVPGASPPLRAVLALLVAALAARALRSARS